MARLIKRPDILPTITLTALVTVLVVYWMRNHERRGGSQSGLGGR